MKLLACILLFIAPVCYGQVKKLQPGRQKPGFLSLTRYDPSRPAVREQEDTTKGRIIQINCWYPSKGGSPLMLFADYVTLAGKELSLSPGKSDALRKGIDTYFAWPASTGASKESFTSFLQMRTPMFAGAAGMLKKKAPLVLLVHGFAADYAYLAEYLASHGNFVLHVPVKGTNTYELDYEGKGLDTQVKDYEFALRTIRQEMNITAEAMAIVGFSFGGQSAVALALRQKNVKAVISLDGGIGSAFGAGLLASQPGFNANLVRFPILHLYNPADPHTDLSWFKAIPHSPFLLVAMKNMQHGHFTSFGLLNNAMPGIMGRNTADPGNGYEAVVVLTQKFIAESMAGNNRFVSTFMRQQLTQFPWIRDCVLEPGTELPGS